MHKLTMTSIERLTWLSMSKNHYARLGPFLSWQSEPSTPESVIVGHSHIRKRCWGVKKTSNKQQQAGTEQGTRRRKRLECVSKKNPFTISIYHPINGKVFTSSNFTEADADRVRSTGSWFVRLWGATHHKKFHRTSKLITDSSACASICSYKHWSQYYPLVR